MQALKTLALTSTAHLSRILMGFFMIKIIAVYLGPEGLGALGQFMSVLSIIYIAAGGGVTNAVIKYAAEYRASFKRLRDFTSAAASYSLVFCSVVALVLVVASPWLSELLLNDRRFYWLFIVLALAQFVFAFVNMITGIANGLFRTDIYSRIQIAGSLLAVPVIWVLVSQRSLTGAALAVVASYSLAGIPAGYYYWRSRLRTHIKWVRPASSDIRKLAAYTAMLVTSALSFPVVEICIRTLLIDRDGLQSAGLWQGAIKLSACYLGFFNVFLAYYFVPMISATSDRTQIKRKVMQFMLVVGLLFLAGGSVFYLWRDFFITLALSNEFAPLQAVIKYQLLGDFFRILSYVLAFITVAKAATRLYVCAEIFQSVMFMLVSYIMVRQGSALESIMQGYAASYAIYLACAGIAFFIYLARERYADCKQCT